MADLTEYKPRQATESWLEYLGRQGPEAVNAVALALAGLRGAPGRGLAVRDSQIARDLHETTKHYIRGSQSALGDDMAQIMKGDVAQVYEPPITPLSPYDAAALRQSLRPANK